MIDLRARRKAFRDGILRDAELRTNAIVGSQRAFRVVDVVLIPIPNGSVLAVGDQVFFRLGLNGAATIIAWSMAGMVGGASAAGTITLDILVGATLATVTTICGTHKPALTAQAERADQAPATDWTVQIPDPRWIVAKVTSTGGTLQAVSLTLRCGVG